MKSINDLVKHKKKIMKNFHSDFFDILSLIDQKLVRKPTTKREAKTFIRKIIPLLLNVLTLTTTTIIVVDPIINKPFFEISLKIIRKVNASFNPLYHPTDACSAYSILRSHQISYL